MEFRISKVVIASITMEPVLSPSFLKGKLCEGKQSHPLLRGVSYTVWYMTGCVILSRISLLLMANSLWFLFSNH